MGRVIHFEIHADDPERATQFYSEVFGWRFDKWEGPVDYWLATTGPDDQPGINGAVMRRRDPAGSVYNTIQVDDVDAAIASVTAHGGTVVLPKMAVPGVGYLFYFKDTEGNIFGAMHDDPSAM